MNAKEFVQSVSTEARLNYKQSQEVIEAVFTAIAKGLVAGEKISIAGFGTFSIKERPERQGINPSTKEKIVIPAKRVVVFKPAKNIKEQVD